MIEKRRMLDLSSNSLNLFCEETYNLENLYLDIGA